MERAVELSVAATVEAVALVFAGAGVERCDAGVACKLGVCAEAVDRADLAKQLCGAERSAARQREQPRRDRRCAFLQFAVEFADRPVEAAAACDEITRDPRLRRLLTAGELAAQPVEPDGAVECAERGVQAGVKLVQMPAQSLLAATSLVNEIVAVVDQQLQLAQEWSALGAPRAQARRHRA